jgi:hypothetical protein
MSTTDAFIFTSAQLWIVVVAAFGQGCCIGSLMEFHLHKFRGFDKESTDNE